MVARITGQLIVILTVTDLRGSAEWYRELFGAREHVYVNADGVLAQVTLGEPASGAPALLSQSPGGP